MPITEFSEKHENERVFILGNGPSLSHTPLEKLSNEYTIALNRIDLLFDTTSWRPTYYVSNGNRKNQPEFVNSAQNIIDEGITTFLYQESYENFGDEENIEYLPREGACHQEIVSAIENKELENVWSVDISEKVYTFVSIISVAAQLAVYMGFNEIYFVGCDLYDPNQMDEDYMIFNDAGNPGSYEPIFNTPILNGIDFLKKNDYPIRSAINALSFKLYKFMVNSNIKSIADGQHFDENYESHIALPRRNVKLKNCHEIINIASYKHDFDVYNATVGGFLEVYPRVDLCDIV